MIVVTGAAGFIGSCLISELNRQGLGEIVLVDDFARQEKMKNLAGKAFSEMLHRDNFFDWLNKNHGRVLFIFHFGARTDTAEQRKAIFDRLNLNYSKKLWSACASHQLPLIYASSAATYGAGEYGYSDNHALLGQLKPLNAYGNSKHAFDCWVLKQSEQPPFWAGLKFFNVYGPNEYHKHRMASAIYHLFSQISEKGEVKLFRSHLPDIPDGEQRRDFIYIMDVLDVCLFLMNKRPEPGIYNLGTGRASSYRELAEASFRAMGKPPVIRFIDTPETIRDNYQYFTEANMEKLRSTGYDKAFYPLEEGVTDYVKTYLKKNIYF